MSLGSVESAHLPCKDAPDKWVFNIVRHNIEKSVLSSKHYRGYAKVALVAGAHFTTHRSPSRQPHNLG
ncbi:MAG: hypothetical protein QOK23_1905 [Gammaproteobacteria bacterium]|jgi:hypothetical protein|nr:hypothetical protein [Gammaproteobacteria bacterium]